MLSYLFAFLFGLCVPAVSSRYAKVYASDLGEFLFFMWHKPRFPKAVDIKKRTKLQRKWRKLILFSIFWAILLTVLFVISDMLLPPASVAWVKTFICLMALLCVIDHQFCLLPDIFTVPLLILGFGYSLWGGIITPQQSFIGACYGFLLPAVCVFITSILFRNAFGGGDVKMLAGLGAWIGFYPMIVLILISVISFIMTAMITKKKAAPYGPHLAFAGVITLFLTITQMIPFL